MTLHPLSCPAMNKNKPLLTDEHGRIARYLRLSVTDRCNFHCSYCRCNSDDTFLTHDDCLRYEEMLTIIEASLALGIEKVRLTGGEPFTRKGFMDFVESIRQQYPQVDLRITTNGALLRPHIARLKELGIKAINISLDTFQKSTFIQITGRDYLTEILENIHALLAADIGVKINAVAMRGITDVEMQQFTAFASAYPVDVRFIEFMPMGSGTIWSDALFMPAESLLEEAQKHVQLTPINRKSSQADQQEKGKKLGHSGPARMYSIENGAGRIGIISALSNHFCTSCNRLRVTSDGQLRSCLFADNEYDLREIIRTKPNKEEAIPQLLQVFEQAIKCKPLGEALLKARQARTAAVANKRMVAIGG